MSRRSSKQSSSQTSIQWSAGDTVYAKWPGSSKYYEAQVLGGEGEKYEVQFKDADKTTDYVKAKDVYDKLRFRSKSPARGRKSRSRSRSRGRSKSPGRPKQTRGASPGRPKKTEKDAPTTPTRSSTRLTKTPSTPTRQSSRLQEKAQKEEEEEKVTVTTTKQSVNASVKPSSKPVEYAMGGPIPVFIFTLLLPASVLYINLACTKTSCTFSKIPTIPRTLSAYYDCDAAMVYLGWLALQFVCAMLPVGRVVDGVATGKKLQYRCNGLFGFVLSLAIAAGLIYAKYPLVSIVYTKFFQLAVTAVCSSFIAGILLFIKSRNIAPSERYNLGNTGNTIYDFAVGRELNPRVLGVDIKTFIIRFAMTSWAMVDLLFLYKNYQDTQGSPSLVLALLVIMQVWYTLDFMIFESQLMSYQYVQREGVGCFSCQQLSFELSVYTVQARYLLDYTQAPNYYVMAALTIMFFFGYFIYRGSNSQKDRFRKNPNDPSLASLETIPTSTGRKLLASGWWGLCRHPNYLGDLMMNVAFALMCGFGSGIVYFPAVLLALIFLGRASEVDEGCKARYRTAWDVYCQRVKYRMIPGVY